MTDQQQKLNIDGVEYLISELSNESKAQIQSLQCVSQKYQD